MRGERLGGRDEVCRGRACRTRRPVVPLVGLEVGRARPGPLVPVRPGLRGDGVADVVDGLGELGDDVMRAVLVARDDEARDAIEGNRQAVVVGLGEHRVHALDHALDDAGGLSEPGGRRQHEDLGLEQLGVDVRPLITLAFVGGDARQEVQVDRADRLAGRAGGFECVTQIPSPVPRCSRPRARA